MRMLNKISTTDIKIRPAEDNIMAILGFLRNQMLKKYVQNMLLNSCLNLDNQIRLISDQKASDIHCIEELKDRGLLRVSGDEVSQFMQGLITNDMKHLDEGSRSMYTMFLNSKGRVMYDAILYKNPKQSAVYVECDKSALHDLQKHLKMFRVRRKIEINQFEDFKVWVLFCPQYAVEVYDTKDFLVKDVVQEKVVPCQAVNFQSGIEFDNKIFDSLANENVMVSWDPRLPILGVRILADDSVDVVQLARNKGIPIVESNMSFKTFRYKLGIGEGLLELPFGKCFPLEMNCDYLHGVSFHKGCYIGQELTARTHHTGVVRKRLMPIFLDIPFENECDFILDAPIEVIGEQGRSIGKLRGIEKNSAIGLIRISEALSAPKLKIGNLTGYTIKPKWWPHEAPKETLLTKKE